MPCLYLAQRARDRKVADGMSIVTIAAWRTVVGDELFVAEAVVLDDCIAICTDVASAKTLLMTPLVYVVLFKCDALPCSVSQSADQSVGWFNSRPVIRRLHPW